MAGQGDWLKGERGAKGDHGQHGDEGSAGTQGDVGVPGAPGAPGTPGAAGAAGAVGERGREGVEGQTGEKGPSGRSAPSNWVAYLILALAILLAAIVFVRNEDAAERQRVMDNGRTALSNCLEIEHVVKDEIRASVKQALARIPTLEYYREHPAERRLALRDARASVERFKARDCYALPTVKAAGIKRPD